MSQSNQELSFSPPSQDENSDRRTWLIACGAAGGVAAVATAVPMLTSMAPSERARSAGAPVEVDITDIPMGGVKTVEWRGKPVWIVRRTPEMLASLEKVETQLADPRSERTAFP
ncbi:MAG: ubiquinol-cytochrome c reductase iron-sulfur subunit N-terminal domain-containing protein, partial [Burkholderiaceae bacterium]